MKVYKWLHHRGLVYAVSVHGTNKKEIEREYRAQWNLEGKKICVSIW